MPVAAARFPIDRPSSPSTVASDAAARRMALRVRSPSARGLEDPEKVTVAFLVAVGAAESGRPTLMFQAKEAVRLAMDGVATGVACDGCPALPDLLARYEKAGGRFMVCPVCFNAKQLDKGNLLPNAELAGSVQLWDWIGDGATTFSY
jgi:predicted peroxiredoxin